MKHLNYLLAVALVLLGFSWASAETVTNYTVDFNTPISTTDHAFKVAPGWKHIVGSVSSGWSTNYMTYNYNSASGVDGTGALYCGTQLSNLDYLVTPAINGTLSLMVKLAESGGYIRFYEITEADDGTLTPGEEVVSELDYNPNQAETFVEISFMNLSPKRYGIVANKAYIDNFAVTGTAEIEYEPGLTVTREGYTSWIYPNCDVENHFTYEFTNITVTNTGERDIALGEEGFSISIAPQNKLDQAVKTLEIPVALAKGESYTFESIVVEETYDDSWTEANGRKRMDIFENMGGTSCTGNWIQPNPYLPGMSVKQGTSDLSTASNASKFGSFGMIGEATTRVATVKNTGAAPLVGTVTLTAEGCFSIDNTTINLAAGESADYTLTAGVETPGVFTGELVFAGEGVESVTIPLSATVLDATKFFEPFESNNTSDMMPAGWWDMDGDWEKTDNTNGDNNYVSADLVAGHKLVTPLLKVTEGEKMSFDAFKKSTSNSDPFINVYYSADRKEWTLVKEIPATELNYSTSTYSQQPTFTTYVVEGVPAGEYYIAFESGYCAIDNVYGFELVPVDYDVVVSEFKVPSTVMANNDVTATVKLQNLLGEAVTEYAPAFYFNEVEVAQAEPVEIPAQGTATVQFTFVPNEVGTFPAYAEFELGDFLLMTNVVDVTVNEESANALVQVGEATTNSGYAPLRLLYNNSESKTIYTAEQMGIANGAKITSFTYKGYMSGSKVLTPMVTVWVENTEDATETTSAALFDTEGMTKVFEGECTFEAKGSSSDKVDMLVVNFDAPFEYTGKNLRVIVRALYTDYQSANFEADGNVTGQCVVRFQDNQETFLTGNASTYAASLPVVYMGVEKEAVTYSGVVNDTEGNPIEGVTVTLTSEASRGATAGPAVYTATTDAEGKFTVNVVQNEKTYNATFSKDGYKDVNVEGIDLHNGSVELDEPVVMELDEVTGVESLNAGKTVASVKYYNVAGQAADKAFQGVNIVVTTYTDGTTHTVKVIK